MPVKKDSASGKIIVTWPLLRKDFYDIYSEINQKTLKKLFDEFKVPEGRILTPRECARVFDEMWLPHEDFEIKIGGVKLEVFQYSLQL